MKRSSLLLHALSLHDRVLEPNQLPVSGRVWAFYKGEMSRENFVGNAVSILFALGVCDASIDWNDDIMAFDAHCNEAEVTITISLQDDSLASESCYFLGIWSCSDSTDMTGVTADDMNFWQEHEMEAPAMAYSVSVLDTPKQLSEIRKMIDGEMFVDHLYDGQLYLAGHTEAYPYVTGRFVIIPCMDKSSWGSFEVRHALYSLRNMMALMACVMRDYDQADRQADGAALLQEVSALSQVLDGDVRTGAWVGHVRKYGNLSCRLTTQTERCSHMEKQQRCFRRLFEAIQHELSIGVIKGIASLSARMGVAFDLAEALFAEQSGQADLVARELQILHGLMHLHMLASQQQLLEHTGLSNQVDPIAGVD